MAADMPDAGQVKNCLIFRPGSIGDAVVSIPAVVQLANQFPEARMTVLSNEAVSTSTESAASVLVALTAVQERMHYATSFTGLRQLWQRLKHEKYDAVFYLGPERKQAVLRRYELFFRVVGIPVRVGFHGRPTLTDLSPLIEHESNRILRWLGFSPQELTQGTVPRETGASDSSKLYFCFCAGGKVPENKWPTAHWNELLQQLSSRLPGYQAVGLGAAADRAETGKILTGWDGQATNCCGTLSVSQTFELLRGATFIISHDTGPIHLAALAEIPCLGIYGNRNPPGKWYPFIRERVVLQSGSSCHGITFERLAAGDQSGSGIAHIGVARVVAAVLRLLGKD